MALLILLGEPKESSALDDLIARADHLSSVQVRRSGEAIPMYRRAIELARHQRNSTRMTSAYIGLGIALLHMHKQAEARQILEVGRQMARRNSLFELEAEALARFVTLHGETGDVESSLRCAEDAYAIGVGHGLLGVELRALNSRLVTLRRVGRMTEAIDAGAAALRRLDEVSPDDPRVPKVVLFQLPYNYGRALIDSGESSRGFALLGRALEASIATGLLAGVWHVMHDTAEWYREQNDFERADRYYQRALAQARLLESRDPEGVTRLGMARLDRARGRLPQAEDHSRTAFNLLSQSGQTTDLPSALIEVARIQSAAGNGDGALASVRQAVSLSERTDLPIDLARSYIELARIDRGRGESGSAQNHAARALAVARQNGLRLIVPEILNELGNLALVRGDLEASEKRFGESVAAAEATQRNMASAEQRIAFMEASQDAYRGWLETRLRLYERAPSQHAAHRALSVVERERNAPLIESRRRKDASLLQIDGHLAQLQWQLTVPAITPSRKAALLAELDEVERRRETIEAAIHDSAQATSDLDSTKLQEQLGPDEALLEYANALIGPIVFVVTRRDAIPVMLTASPQLASRCRFFASIVCSGRGHDALPAGSRISRELLAPALSRLPASTRRLLISASGDLAALPFAALPYPPESTSPVLQRFEIGYIPSLAALARVRARGSPDAKITLLAVADPAARPQMSYVDSLSALDIGKLPSADREVQAIRRYAASADVLSGANASEAALKSRPLAAYHILHFATHTLLDPISPRRSAVILARGSGEDDGLLQPREIEELRLNGQFVMLSGCKTAAGRTSSVGGTLSLARSFLEAGAKSVVGTLADVEDQASADFVGRMYDHIADGKSVGAALRAAQLEVAGSRPYETVAVWSPWIVSGDATMTIALRPHRGRPFAVLIVGVLAVFAAALYLAKL